MPRLPPSVPQDHGYATAGIGKWNIGFCNESYLPWNRGFDWYLGYMTQGISYYDHQASTYSYQSGGRRLRDGDTNVSATHAATGTDTDGDSSSTPDERPLFDLLEGVAANADSINSAFSPDTIVNSSVTGGGDGEYYGSWRTGVAYRGNYSTRLFGDKAVERITQHFSKSNTTDAAKTGGAPGSTTKGPADLGGADDASAGDFEATGGDTAAQPLFMWIAFHAVHRDDDSEPPGSLLTEDQFTYLHQTLPSHGIATNRARLAEALIPVDIAARKVVDTLDAAGALDHSVVVVHSDNGGDTCHAIGDVAPWGSNWPLRGRKMSYFEGGVRVPAFVYAPSLLPKARQGKSYAGLMHHVDWLATFVRLAGGDAGNLRAAGYASRDQWDAIVAGPTYMSNNTVRDEILFDLPQNASFKFLDGGNGAHAEDNLYEWHGVVALRHGDFKLLYTAGNETWFPDEMRSDTCPYYAFSDTCATNLENLDADCAWGNYMFDLSTDPYEKHNLYHQPEHQDRRKRLEARAFEMLGEYAGAFNKDVAFGTTSETWSAAREAFYAAGDYVVPWGCDAV